MSESTNFRLLTATMQAPANLMPMVSSPIFTTTTTNTTYQTKEEAAEAWAACLAEAKNDPNKYPRMPIENGPFASFEEMWAAKENGDYDPSKPSFPAPPITLAPSFYILSNNLVNNV